LNGDRIWKDPETASINIIGGNIIESLKRNWKLQPGPANVQKETYI
jgi:hypothetical protein